MDGDNLLPEAQEAQAPISSHDSSRSLPASLDDKWNAYKDEIHKIYIKENNTLEVTMKVIEEQGGPRASKRTWKSKLKEWTYEKNLTSRDWNILSAKAKKRKNEDGKETVFYHWDSEISLERIKRPRKTPKASEAISPSADIDFLPPTESRTPSINDPISKFSNIAFGELETMIISEDEITETFMVDLQAANVNRQQDLHFMPGRATRTSSPLLLQPLSNRVSSGQNFNELWNHDFDEVFNRNNLNQACSNIFVIGGLNSHPMMFFDEEYQVTSSFPIGTSSSFAKYNTPWFQCQLSLKKKGSLSYNPRMSQVSRLFTPSFDMHLTSPDPAYGAVELKERFRLLCSLCRSPPCSMEKKFLPKFSSKLQELIPESFDGEILSKLQLLFHPSNNSPLQVLSEFALYFLSNNMLNEKQTDEFFKWAIKKKLRELFRSLLAMKIPTVESFSDRIIESAARTGNAEVLRFLIDCGLGKHYFAGNNGGRYLQLTLFNNMTHLGVAHLLLDNGAEVNPMLGDHLPYNCPPLCLAAMECCIEILTRLLEAGAEVDTKFENDTALSIAVLSKSHESVRQLLQAGADVDDGEIHGQPILDWAYLHCKSIYWTILPKSQRAKTLLTISGVLSAAKKGKQALYQYLNGKRAENLEQQNRVLEEALWYAVQKKEDYSIISVLLDFGVDPNVTTINTSEPPLVLIARDYDINMLKRLLNAGAKIDSSKLFAQVRWDEDGFDTLNFLIEQGADIVTFGGRAIRNALYNSNLRVVKLLLSFGANINAQDSYADGYSILARAARYGDIRTVKYLIDEGAMINEPLSVMVEITALQAAALVGKLEMVIFLLDAGADVNAEPNSRNGMTTLEASLDFHELNEERAAIFQLLLNKGADINGPSKQRCCKRWNSALVSLITRRGNAQLIQLALNAGADVNRRGQGMGARTPLQAAAEVGNLELVKILLDKGAKLNAGPSANYGRTALQAACVSYNPKLELVRYLLKEGAEINAVACSKSGLTALQGAAIQGHIKIALMLLEAGAEVNAEPALIQGRMALDGAAEHGRLDMVQMLLNFSAKSEVPGGTGFDNAIRLARENGHFAVARLLESQLNS